MLDALRLLTNILMLLVVTVFHLVSYMVYWGIIFYHHFQLFIFQIIFSCIFFALLLLTFCAVRS